METSSEDYSMIESSSSFAANHLFVLPPFSARLCLSLAPVSQLLWTRKERDCVQSHIGLERKVQPQGPHIRTLGSGTRYNVRTRGTMSGP